MAGVVRTADAPSRRQGVGGRVDIREAAQGDRSVGAGAATLGDRPEPCRLLHRLAERVRGVLDLVGPQQREPEHEPPFRHSSGVGASFGQFDRLPGFRHGGIRHEVVVVDEAAEDLAVEMIRLLGGGAVLCHDRSDTSIVRRQFPTSTSEVQSHCPFLLETDPLTGPDRFVVDGLQDDLGPVVGRVGGVVVRLQSVGLSDEADDL